MKKSLYQRVKHLFQHSIVELLKFSLKLLVDKLQQLLYTNIQQFFVEKGNNS